MMTSSLALMCVVTLVCTRLLPLIHILLSLYMIAKYTIHTLPSKRLLVHRVRAVPSNDVIALSRNVEEPTMILTVFE
jgi:hypothetical protein